MTDSALVRAAKLGYEQQRAEFDALLTRARSENRDLTDAERDDAETRSARLETLYADIVAATGEQTRADAVGQLAASVESGTGGRPAEGDFGHTPLQALDGSYTRAGGDDRSAALRSADASVKAGQMAQHAREKLQSLLDNQETSAEDRAVSARWARVAGSEHYRSAFLKLIMNPQHGHMLWSPREQEAFRAAYEVQAMLRANEGTPSAGGYMLPTQLDPTLNLTNAGSSNNLRSIARVVATSTSAWNGISTAGSTAQWKAEGAVAADASPVLAPVPVPVYLGDVYIPYSYELEMDAADFEAELTRMIVDGADQLQAQAFATGTGSGQPTGLITAINAVSGAKVASATADTLVAADVVGLQNVLPPRFQSNAQWFANLKTINQIGQFQSANGSLLFPEVANNKLLRRPLNELSFLDYAGQTASAGNDRVLLYGDPQQFVIVDRIGSVIEPIMNVFDPTTGRPTGQRGVFLWFRTGSNIITSNGFKLLTA